MDDVGTTSQVQEMAGALTCMQSFAPACSQLENGKNSKTLQVMLADITIDADGHTADKIRASIEAAWNIDTGYRDYVQWRKGAVVFSTIISSACYRVR